MNDSDKQDPETPEPIKPKAPSGKSHSRIIRRKSSKTDSDEPVQKTSEPEKAKARSKKTRSPAARRERSKTDSEKPVSKASKPVKGKTRSKKAPSWDLKYERSKTDSDEPVQKTPEPEKAKARSKKTRSPAVRRERSKTDFEKPVSKAPETVEGRASGKKTSSSWIIRNFKFIFKNKMYKPMYWLLFFRFLKFKLRHPGIKTEGPVFLPRKYEFKKGKDAQFTIGAWVWIGKGCAIRAHEGSLRIGSKVAMGGNNTINCFEHVEIGDECLMADNIYIADFDHWYIDPKMSIRSQGIRKEPVIIEPDVWIGEKSTILRGVTVRSGSIVGAMSLVTRDVPEYAIVGGVPARVLKYRRSPEDVAWDEGAY